MHYLPALAVMAFSLSWTAIVVLQPREGQAVAAVFADRSGESALAGTIAAGADAVQAFGASKYIVIARSNDPDFVVNLYRRGALLVMRAPDAAGCSQ